jgi:putative flippase GtrA
MFEPASGPPSADVFLFPAAVKGRIPSTRVQEFIRYFLVSLVALAADTWVLFALVEWAHFHYLPSAAISFSMGTAIAFLLSEAWVFERRAYAGRAEGLIRFALIGIGGLGVNLALMFVFTDIFGAHYLLSKGLAAGASFAFNFLVRRAVLFSRSVPRGLP